MYMSSIRQLCVLPSVPEESVVIDSVLGPVERFSEKLNCIVDADGTNASLNGAEALLAESIANSWRALSFLLLFVNLVCGRARCL